jgi:hypothetical protein
MPPRGQSENACRRGNVSGAATAHVTLFRRLLVVHALLLARRHREEQLLDADQSTYRKRSSKTQKQKDIQVAACLTSSVQFAAIVSVVGSALSSSTAIACGVTDGRNDDALRHKRAE